jgi:hypothetical protein
MPLKIFPYEYRRDLVSQMPGVFVFGDNVNYKGFKGQAIIRDLPNAYGFETKWLPLTIPDAYFRDGDIEVELIVEKHLLAIERMLVQGKKVWWPKDGVGTGLARWPEFAPKLLNHVNSAVDYWTGHYVDN